MANHDHATAPHPTLSVGINPFGSPPDGRSWRSLLDQATALERVGVHRVVVPDHVVNGPEVAAYPWGRFPTPPDGDWLEPLGVLTAVATATERIRLGTGILVAPLRPAVLLAKQVATLDVLSDGRVDLGVGTGWQRDEFDAAGVDFDRRGQLLTDTIAACRSLWRGGPSRIDTPSIAFDDVYCHPTPVQPRLPVWFSGTLHERNVTRIVELGDGWIPIMGATHDDIAAGARLLRERSRDAGRDPASLQVRCSLTPVRADDGSVDLDATRAQVTPLAAAGVTDLHVNARLLGDSTGELADRCAQVVGLLDGIAPTQP